MDKLKPCPFCGGEAEIAYSRNYYVWCDKCETRGDWYSTEAEAIKAWNTRAERTCRISMDDYGICECDKCGWYDYWNSLKAPNYCPVCGAEVVDDGGQ